MFALVWAGGACGTSLIGAITCTFGSTAMSTSQAQPDLSSGSSTSCRSRAYIVGNFDGNGCADGSYDAVMATSRGDGDGYADGVGCLGGLAAARTALMTAMLMTSLTAAPIAMTIATIM